METLIDVQLLCRAKTTPRVTEKKCELTIGFFFQPMVVYNFICALTSLYSLVYIVMSLIPNWPQSLFDTTENTYVKHAMYVYWMTKILELMDTVIMILRHRTRQISFLHVSINCSLLNIF